VKAKKVLEEGRGLAARAIQSRPEEIVFTSGGTESNNLAISGVIEKRASEGVSYEKIHIITSVIEHSSVLECLRYWEKKGVTMTYIGVNEDGIVSTAEIEKAITSDTVLVSIMYANNEIGVIEPISEIGQMIREYRKQKEIIYPLFHTDACQAPLFLSLFRESLRTDLISLDGHKIYGPKGVGILFVKNGVKILPMLFGGGQENGLRPTTENISGIVGMSVALTEAVRNREIFSKKMQILRDLLILKITSEFPEAIFNGSLKYRLPNNLNISFPWIQNAEFAVLWLDARGIACSTKSSCLKGEEESYVVRSLDPQDKWRARTTLRFTFGARTRRNDILRIVRTLKKLKEFLSIAK